MEWSELIGKTITGVQDFGDRDASYVILEFSDGTRASADTGALLNMSEPAPKSQDIALILRNSEGKEHRINEVILTYGVQKIVLTPAEIMEADGDVIQFSMQNVLCKTVTPRS